MSTSTTHPHLRPASAQFAELASGGLTVPITKEILADTETPVSAYLKLRPHSDFTFLFESVEGGERAARYSFLGINPSIIFRSKDQRATIEDRATGTIETIEGDPRVVLRELMAKYEGLRLEGLPRFTGGAVGFLGYDGIRLAEQIPDSGIDDLGADDMVFALFETILAFDNLRHTVLLIANARVQEGDEPDQVYAAAAQRIDETEQLLAQQTPAPRLPGGRQMGTVHSNVSRQDYTKAVNQCLEYIRAGDIFQVVFAQRFQLQYEADPFEIYRVLRTVNPSPYMFHITQGDLQILGASPEILVRVEDGTLDVRPLAGTRARGVDEADDQRLEEELLADEKDRAEHVMLVDLGRNDVGRVSKYDTVRVTEMMTVERYSHVMHIVSDVRGQLKEGMDSLDALFACYPAGTLSGAPKIRAMEIIDELEPTRRGIYGGAVGYLDFSGNLDTCIAIRTMVVKDGVAYVQAGGGIVADSDPDAEYQETVNKAMALFRAVEMANRGSIAPSGESISGLLEGTEISFLDPASSPSTREVSQ
ncbi:MAG: anthranilate synthase component I [Gemmatimonadetes bacterium]|jgi:anthranilate synthase component 1|nr:anthranilate synthase component I [Gemmatimonadota bacterium]MBT4612286.1 anthranilate synthase component I [Gemmatimonadota bacterium]MBT5060671.1 anthranilate synthase component I [Gemmatimonadota bacterium]MBT5145419.1 anthranilate synthase component I [Gemmatimonadota bacterium]MBT5591607.1 anthranilate synthase component I [Gemmatimonadota bacterium]